MKSIGIVTDSHSGISQEEAARLGIRILPMPFYINEECYYEGVTISRDAFFEKLRGGRISPATASLGTLLNIKPVLKFDVGTLDTFKKCRGFGKAKSSMLEAVQHDLHTTFRDAYENKEIHLLAASSASKEETEEWISEIKAA